MMQYVSDKTYNICSESLSNTVPLVSLSRHIDGSENRWQVVIQDSSNELLELVPAVPRLHRMNVLLKGHEWEEGHVEESFRAVSSTWARSYVYNGEAYRDYFFKEAVYP